MMQGAASAPFRRTKMLRWALAVSVVGTALCDVVLSLALVLAPEEAETDQDFVMVLLGALAALGLLVGLVVSFVLLARFLYLAAANSKEMLDPSFTMAGHFSWGCFLIPGVNLIRPYQVVRTILELAATAAGRPRALGLVIIWWGAWLASLLQLFASDGPLAVVGSGFFLVSGVCLALLALRIGRYQDEIAAHRGLA